MFGRTLLIIASMVISCIISSSSATVSSVTLKTNYTRFIKSSCTETTYPQLCYSSLEIHASTIQTSPKRLATMALDVALAKARSTYSKMVKLSRAQGLNPREVGAIKDCMEEVDDAVYELRKSIAEMDKSSKRFELVMSDVQTWVSVALTDEDTCSDGFAGNRMNGKLKTIVRKQIEAVAQLTSNSLALVNSYASRHG